MRATLDFLLFGWLGMQSLLTRPRFAEHSRETFAAVLDTCERIAAEKFAPFNTFGTTWKAKFWAHAKREIDKFDRMVERKWMEGRES